MLGFDYSDVLVMVENLVIHQYSDLLFGDPIAEYLFMMY
jgi:hypothetical protein